MSTAPLGGFRGQPENHIGGQFRVIGPLGGSQGQPEIKAVGSFTISQCESEMCNLPKTLDGLTPLYIGQAVTKRFVHLKTKGYKVTTF